MTRPAALSAERAAALAHDGWRDLAAALGAPQPPAWHRLHPDRRYAAVAAAGQAQRGADDEGWHAAYTGYLVSAGWSAGDNDEPAHLVGLLLAWPRLGPVARACVQYQWASVRAAARLERTGPEGACRTPLPGQRVAP